MQTTKRSQLILINEYGNTFEAAAASVMHKFKYLFQTKDCLLISDYAKASLDNFPKIFCLSKFL